MNGMDFSATQMIWKPALIRLTQVGNPQVNGGAPTPVFLDPNAISYIFVSLTQFNNLDGSKSEPVTCTNINCCHYNVAVIESPETVAMMRDRSLGYEPKLSAA